MNFYSSSLASKVKTSNSSNGFYGKTVTGKVENNFNKNKTEQKASVSGSLVEAGYKTNNKTGGNIGGSVKLVGGGASVGVQTGAEAYINKYEGYASYTTKGNKTGKISGEVIAGGVSAEGTFKVSKNSIKVGAKVSVGVGVGLKFEASW